MKKKSPTDRILIVFLLLMVPALSFSLDYYWIGGSGNWSDISHWATTSGGAVQHDQIPTAADNVIFDQNSFTAPGNTIVLNLDFIFCRDLDFRNINQAITIMGPDRTIMSIHGSIFLHPMVALNFKGSFDFKSDVAGNELFWFGQQPSRINFLGNGSWTLATDLQVDSLIHIEFGNLIFDPVQVSCKRFEVFSRTRVDLDFGESEILISGSRTLAMPSYQWRESLHFEGGQIVVKPGNSIIRLTGIKSSIGFYYLNEVRLDNVELGVLGGDHLLFAAWSGNFEFKRLHLMGNTYLQGSFNMQQLELEGANVYTFQSNFEQKIGTLIANADCGATTFLKASEGGQPAMFTPTQGPQSVDFMMLQDIQVNGPTYQATNAIDLGGNKGWNIQTKTSTTFYWIGGTGNWNDVNHWSFTTGGPPSGCLPTANDDVIFDQNSFTAANQQVMVNVQNAFCHSFDWRLVDRPCLLTNVMSSNKSSIHVFGSLWFSPLMQNNFEGDFLFESPHGNNEILTAGNDFKLNVHFNSALGEWTLEDEFFVMDTILFNAGILRSNDQNIICFHLLSETSAFRELHLGKSIIRLVMTDAHPYYWSRISFYAPSLTIFPGTSLIKCENATSFNAYLPGRIDLHEIIFESVGGMSNDNNPQAIVNIAKATFYVDGDFRNEFNIDTLIFSPGWKYTMFMNTVLNIDSLSAHGNCDGSIYFASFPKGIQTRVNKKSGTVKASELMVEGIIGEGGAAFEAQSSIDLGLNSGWTFTEKAPRTLYWVGNEGDWHDRQHWSLSTGGMGGECVPTAIDDVIFDANSFDGMWQRVGLRGSRSPICHTMIWQNVPDFVAINDGELYLTGSLFLEENVDFQPWTLIFSSDSLQNKITTSGNPISWIEFMGQGCWTLQDDLNAVYRINIRQGTFKTNSKMVTTGRIYMDSYPVDFSRKLVLDSSYILLTQMPTSDDQFFISSNKVSIDAGHSMVEFSGINARSRMYGMDTLTLNKVLFSNIQGTSTIEQWDQSHFQFNRLQFNNNGIIYGDNEMDSLLLAPGKEYVLEFSKFQKINSYLYAIGNNCTPISIRSTEPGQQARMFSKEAKVVADFVQLQDQDASGGANFTAGSHSTDISNNSGWIFDPAPDHIEVGFLGSDRTLCRDSSITLSAFNFSPGESYLWNNSSTGSSLPVATAGTYWAKVTFDNNCVISDTIVVLDPLTLDVDLGADSTLCAGQSLLLDADIQFPETHYTWQDGTEGPELEVSEPGEYAVAIEIDGCFFQDTIKVSYKPLPDVSISGASSACEGDVLLLDATVPGGTYRWQDNSLNPGLEVLTDGIYSVEVEVDQCSASDTVEIVFTPRPFLDLGLDTTLCEDETLNLDVFIDAAVYLWQDSSQTNQYEVSAPGTYWVELTKQNCSVRDSIMVSYQPKPMLPQLMDTALCEGTQWSLALNEPVVSYRWSNGLQSGSIVIDKSGDYEVSANLNGCEQSRSFNVRFEPPPQVDLGADPTLCEGEEMEFAFSEPSVSYIWQGSQLSNSFSVSQTGTYTVSAEKLNCQVSDTIHVLFNPSPFFSLGPDLHLCPGDSFLLAPDRATGNRLWQNGANALTFSGDQPGLYWLTIEENDCAVTDSVVITNSDPLIIDLGRDTTVCADKGIILNAFHPNAQRYLWQDGSEDPEKSVTLPGIYQVKLSDGQCSFDYAVDIAFRECSYFSIFVPNAFTPNGDGVNDTFLPLINPAVEIDHYLLQIFNRWGGLVYSSNDPTQSWTGLIKGDQATIDSYLYSIQFDYVDDEGAGRYEDGGTVVLVR
jgi:gliding motility-associated-like protein